MVAKKTTKRKSTKAKKAAPPKKALPKVHLPKLLDTTLLAEHPNNSNKQNRHTFKELKESIQENGFDESLLVIPKDDDIGYWVVSGNHRFRAAQALGLPELPCVVRDDWDEVSSQIELVRRNFVRGNIDKDAFTVAVNTLSEEANLNIDIIRERMGFEDPDVFADYYKKEAKKERRVASNVVAQPQVRIVDDLSIVLSSIFEQYGDTVPHSFIVFPAGGRNHLYVQSTPALKKTLDLITAKCIADGLDINVALGGLLQMGIGSSDFIKDDEHKELKKVGTKKGKADL